MKQRPIDYLAQSGPLVRGLVVGVGLLVIGGLWLLAGRLTILRSNQITLFAAFVSGVLTFGLIWIYLKIAEETIRQSDLQEDVMAIQSQQADIMERQEELMEFQYLPRIRLRDFELLPNNQIQLTLANVGNGLAERIFLRTAVFVRSEQNELPLNDLADKVFILNDREFAVRPGYTQLVRGEEGIVPSDLVGESLRPDEGEVTFRSRARFGAEPLHSPEDQYGFVQLPPMLEKIHAKGFDDVHIELSIVYSDIEGDVHTENVLGRTVRLGTGDQSLDDLINTDFVTPWSPMDDEERIIMIEESDIYPPL